VKGFVAGGYLASGLLTLGGSLVSGNAVTTNFAVVGGPSGASSALTMPALFQGQAGSGPTVVGTPQAQQGNTYGEGASFFLPEPPEAVPGTIDPSEPIADPYVRMEMRRALDDSHPYANPEDPTTKEQGGWIVKRAGVYKVIRWKDPKATYNSIARPPGKPPAGTVAAFHTHRLDPGSASPSDWAIARKDPFPNYIVGPHGVYRLTNNIQSFLGPLGGGGSNLLPWIVMGTGVAVGTVGYCYSNGC
jgi:hypothetical protein